MRSSTRTEEPEELGAASGALAKISFRIPAGAGQPPDLAGEMQTVGGLIEVRTATPTSDLQRLTTWALEREVELAALQLQRPTLEETYLQLIGTREAA